MSSHQTWKGETGNGWQSTNKATDEAGYNNYNTAANAINDWGVQNNDNWTNVGDSAIDYRYGKKKTSGGRHKKWSSSTEYVNGNTGNDILDDYTNHTSKLGNAYGMNGTSWSDYANQASGTFNKLYDNTSDSLKSSTVAEYTDAYSPYQSDNQYSTLINNKNTSDYNDAVALLQRDLARGYLSQTGYDTAVNKLSNQSAANLQNLNDLGSAQYKTWVDDLNQRWADNTITPDDYSWMKYYDNWKNDNMNGLFSDAQTQLGNYADAYISDDLFNNAIDANLYDPDTYAAEGAKYQGLYDPFNRNSTNRRRRVTLDNIGEY